MATRPVAREYRGMGVLAASEWSLVDAIEATTRRYVAQRSLAARAVTGNGEGQGLPTWPSCRCGDLSLADSAELIFILSQTVILGDY